MQDAKSTAFYLKYRPQSLHELIGQENVKKSLLAAFSSNKLSHAYLFVGPRGTGKTSTARILAKMANCEEKDVNKSPCNKCDSCISITNGSHLDLIEIDAASNRGIDDIRLLREKINLAPSSAKKKIYIIDEVHMLTPEAFNALLKTLEEPPAHALFILATTESHKIPQTILSRVQRLDFKLATIDELVQTLGRIAKEEKIEIDVDGLKIVAQKADGSFRDGVKILDQASAWEGKITASLIQEKMRSSKFEESIKLLEALATNSSKNVLLETTKQINDGVDIKESISSLMEIMRYMMFIKSDLSKELVEPFYGEEKTKLLLKLSEKFETGVLLRNLDLLQEALEKLKTTSILSLPLELAVVQMCGVKKVYQETEIEKERIIVKKEGEVSDSPVIPAESLVVMESPKTSSKSEGSSKTASNEEFTISEADGSELSKIKEKWNFVLETVRQNNFSLEALLRSVEVGDCNNSTVVIKVPYSFHQRILEAPKNRELVEAILSDILGKNIRMVTAVGVRRSRKEDLANIEVAADDEIIRVASEIFNSDTVN